MAFMSNMQWRNYSTTHSRHMPEFTQVICVNVGNRQVAANSFAKAGNKFSSPGTQTTLICGTVSWISLTLTGYWFFFRRFDCCSDCLSVTDTVITDWYLCAICLCRVFVVLCAVYCIIVAVFVILDVTATGIPSGEGVQDPVEHSDSILCAGTKNIRTALNLPR